MITRYPTDRVNSFTDAIFSIALTLLILEVKVPSTEEFAKFGTLGALQHLIPSFIALLVSFFVTAAYWRAHLGFARYIKEYDDRLLWLTIWLLLFVVFMPFSTAFYAKNFNIDGPFIFYCLNLVLIGLFNYLIVVRIIKMEKSHTILTPLLASRLKFRALVAPLIWLLAIALALAMPNNLIPRITFFLIFIILAIGERRYKRKFRQGEFNDQ